MKRRQLLLGAACGAAGAVIAGAAWRGRGRPERTAHPGHSPELPPVRRPPRALVIVQLSGGIDSVLTLDPKTPSEVEPWVDNPVRPADIVEAGGIRLGPQFAGLARWAPRMAVLHGVQVESVNHVAASWQLVRMRTVVTETMPGILDLVARHRAGQPLGSITVGDLIGRFYTPGWAVHGLPFVKGRAPAPQGIAPFEQMAPEELAMLSRALRAQLRGGALRPADRTSIEQVAALLDRLPGSKRFALEDWKPHERMAIAGEALQRVLWGLENDLIAGAYVIVTRNDWDSHFLNMRRQQRANGGFVPLFGRFLEQLATRRNQHGTLLDNTTVVVTGELGRYPRLNSDKGKDHLPELSMLFLGAGIDSGGKGRVLGQTGRDMLGVPMDHETGRLAGSSHILLDDVGTTLLHLFGIEPTQYGYAGRVIRPLLA